MKTYEQYFVEEEIKNEQRKLEEAAFFGGPFSKPEIFIQIATTLGYTGTAAWAVSTILYLAFLGTLFWGFTGISEDRFHAIKEYVKSYIKGRKVDMEEFKATIEDVRKKLKGGQKGHLSSLISKMEDAFEKKDYAAISRYKDEINNYVKDK